MSNHTSDTDNSFVVSTADCNVHKDKISTPLTAILERARDHAASAQLKYAGGVRPNEAWMLVNSGIAVLVDVRTIEERKFVGHVPGSIHIAWMTGTAMVKNPRFLRELSIKVPKTEIVLFLCRSGKRSAGAAEAAAKMGYENAFNVLEGFEGDLDVHQRRGYSGGWKHSGLPWVQD